MSWHRRIAERRRPDGLTHLGMMWTLFACRWFGIALTLRFRSDSSFDQRAECNRLRWVVEGEYVEHRELPRLGELTPAVEVEEGAYVYGNDEGLWMSRNIATRQITIEPYNTRGGVELLDARTVADKIVDFPRWMEHEDVVFNSERQVWMLVISWGGGWR